MLNLLKHPKRKNALSNITRITTEVVVIFAFFLILGLLNKNLLFFSDTVHYSYSYPDNKKTMSALSTVSEISYLSGADTEVVTISNQLINSEYTEFTVSLPPAIVQDLSTVTLNIQYKPGNAKNIFIGPQNIKSNKFDYYPLYSQSLENLEWPKVSNDKYTLWQRETVYPSIDNFLLEPPELITQNLSDEASVQLQVTDYYSNLDQSSIVKKYIKLKNDFTANMATPFVESGFTSYIFAPQEGTVSVKVDKLDNNYYKGADVVGISIYDGANNLLLQDTIDDDGVETAGGSLGPLQSHTITFTNDDMGLYKIKLTGKDSYIKISVNQPFLVVENTLMLRDNLIYPTNAPLSVFTDATELSIPVWHVDATNQKLTINDEQTVTLDSSRSEGTKTEISIDDYKKINKIQLEKNHLGIQNSTPEIKRYFSFSADSYFNPTPLKFRKLDTSKDLSESSTINYIISRYHNPKFVNNNYFQSNIQFDLSKQSYIDQNKITFSIYTPVLGKTKNDFKIILLDVIFEK